MGAGASALRSMVATTAPVLRRESTRACTDVSKGVAAGRMPFSGSGQAQSVEDAIAMTDSEGEAAHLLPPIIAAFPIWLTTHRELNTSRRVRVVYDILAEELAKL